MFKRNDDEKRLAILEDRMIRHVESADHVLEEIKQMSLKQGEKIDSLCIQVHNLDAKIDLDAKNTDIKIAQSNEKLRDYIMASFATKQQLTKEIDSIKTSARIMGTVMAAIGGLAAWVFDHFIK